MTKEKSFDRDKFINALDIVILLGLAVYVFNTAISTTTFMIHLPQEVLKVLMISLTAVSAVKIILLGNYSYKWMSIPLAAVYCIVSYNTGYEFMLFIALFTVGLVGINYKKILAAFLIPSAMVVFPMLFASFSGAILNLVNADGLVNSAWGSCFHTEMASALLFLLLLSWVYLKNIPDVLFLIPGGLVLIISAFEAGSRTATVLSVTFLGFILFKILEDRLEKSGPGYDWLERTANWIVRFSFPVLLVFMIIMVTLYKSENSFALWYNELSQNRLAPAAKMLEEWGIKPFGTFFEMSGNGWSTFKALEYTFIDSSYLQLLIRYGLVTALFVALIWSWMSDRVLRAGNRRMAFAMLLIALDSVSEQHFVELNYNILLVMPFAFMETKEKNEDATMTKWLGDPVTRKFRSTQLLALAIGIAVFCAFLPTVFSYYRTIFNGFGMTDGKTVIDGVLVYAISLVSLLVFAAFIWFFSKLIAGDALEKTISKKYLLLTVTSVLFMLVGFLAVDSMVDRVYRGLLDCIAGEAEIITDITAHSKGKVYMDRYPEAYKKQFAAIDRSFYDGEDLSRKRNTTLIVDADDDLNCLSRAGYAYLQISPYDAIYTNDESVRALLEGEGYAFTSVNSKVHDIDLKKAASINGLKSLEDGGMLVEGEGRSLVFGPFLDLYPGHYQVTYNLKKPAETKSSSDAKEILGNIRISSYWGKNIIADIDITEEMFDENGQLKCQMNFEGNGRGYEFLLFMKGDNALEVERIAWQRLD
ncbi:hypothetical protein [Butyrivibrio sp. AE2032]|uniref:hypothetical protein n=1 Tax=Butyrivibrio sp. AE2032 TaxID=1458463 RepID=UPI0005530D9F|nr:hypothetical protein [Butyrivibrio sp. AE2032]